MEQENKYRKVISLVIHKYASRLPKEDKEDLTQEAYIALSGFDVISDKLAYTIVKRRIIDCLRKMPFRTENIDDPSVARKVDFLNSINPNYNNQLDGRRAMTLADRLPEPYRGVTLLLFNDEWTIDKIAKFYGKSKKWVFKIKHEALTKLRSMM